MTQFLDYGIRVPGIGKGHAEQLIKYAIDHDFDLKHCLQGTFIQSDFLVNPIDVSPSQELILIENLINKFGDAFKLGFEIGRSYNMMDLGLYGMALMNSINGAHAAKITKRFLDLSYNFTDMKLQINADKIVLNWFCRYQYETNIQQFLIARDFGICHMVQDYILDGRSRNVFEIGFAFDYLKGMDDIANAFSTNLKSNQSQHYLVTEISQLKRSRKNSNIIAANAIEDSYLDKISHIDYDDSASYKIKEYLFSLDKLHITKKDASNALHMSERTLTRHLEKEGETWRSLISTIRLEKAQHLLTDSNKSLQQICDTVGYANVSSLSHAFHKYKGVSPTEYRKGCIAATGHASCSAI